MTRHAVTALLLVVLGTLTGCREGPARDTVAAHIQSRLDRNFKKGVFRVASLQRKGHYSYREEGGEAERLLVYYNAELELLDDYRLSNWDQLNVGSLISVLGATPNGVEGVKPGGNKKGDRLSVRGASAYARQGESWRPVAYLPEAREGKKGQTTDKDRVPYRRHLKRLGEVGARFQKSKDKRDLEALTAKLAEVRAHAERRLGRREGWVTLATGDPSGEYHRQGQGLARLLSRAGHEARAFRSSGSIENCRLVNEGEVLFGYSQNDIAHMAHGGTGVFDKQIPLRHLRALCSLYPEAVQIVTLRASGLRRLQDLRGKRVNVGSAGSGVRANAVQVLQAAGLSLGDFSAVGGAPLSQAMRDLREQRLDALFFTSAYPNRALYKLAEKSPIELVPLQRDTVERLRARYPHLAPLELPANTYPSVGKRLTVQVTAMLVAHRDAPAAKVRTLLEQLFANVKALSRGSLQAYYISRDKALSGVSIPLHPAARAFFD